uniref:Uncharacterized protein n=1 Tax=Podoviridae sp. ct2m58 TaxID=2827721 RepID=A0A8S5TMC5_9CAUD|nr:MAG TPA: hypothetical protein [Podoviridae sp. ct2m58]
MTCNLLSGSLFLQKYAATIRCTKKCLVPNINLIGTVQ